VSNRKKDSKIAKKDRKIALSSLFHGGQRKNRPKNSTIKPLSTISLPCMKIQRGGHGPSLPPAANAHAASSCKYISPVTINVP